MPCIRWPVRSTFVLVVETLGETYRLGWRASACERQLAPITPLAKSMCQTDQSASFLSRSLVGIQQRHGRG